MGTESGPPVSGEPSAAAAESTPPVRASDEERHRVVEVLGDHAAAGRITLAELEDRVAQAYAATTRTELTTLTRDLPTASQELAHPPASDTELAAPSAGTPVRKRSRWFFALMGGSTWRGKRRLAGRINVISIMGGDDIDLREAEIEGNELVVNAVSIMGGSTIYVPDTLDIELSGPAIMGGNDERGSTREARPGAPLIRIRSFSLMGGVDVWRLPAETRGLSLREARRAAKAIERGNG